MFGNDSSNTGPAGGQSTDRGADGQAASGAGAVVVPELRRFDAPPLKADGGRALKNRVRRWLREIGYEVQGVRHTPRHLLEPALNRRLEFDDVVCRHMFEHGDKCVVLQIGAYDGLSSDPLRKYIVQCGWQGVMLEPQPRPANRLHSLYANSSGVRIIQAAVDAQRGPRSLYTVEGDEVPGWAGGMASFDRRLVARQERNMLGSTTRTRELTIGCVTFDDVLGWLPPGRLDLLQIDAEGADAYLLSLFPFERVRPSIIQWEVKHIPREEQEATLDRLCRFGYRVSSSGDADMLAVAS